MTSVPVVGEASLELHLHNLVAAVFSDDPQQQLAATTEFRKLLSLEQNVPVDKVVAVGVLPRFLQFLTYNHNPVLQFEAAWVLINIASGSSQHTRHIIEIGAVPIFVQLLSSNSDDIREQAVWALGNIAGDSPQCRDFVLQHGVMEPLLQNLVGSTKLSMLRNATWTLSNLCRGKPQPPFELVSPAIPALARLLYSTDDEVVTNVCWALSFLSDGTNDKIQAVIETGVCRRLVELLLHTSRSVQTAALRTVGNIVTGDDLQTQLIVNVSGLPSLLFLLNSPKKGIRKEACWAISNITSGNRALIQAVIDANIFPPLIRLLASDDRDIKKEAAWAVSNAISGATAEQVRYLASQGCIKPICDLLTTGDAQIVAIALEGIENILKAGDRDGQASRGPNPYASYLEAEGLVDRLQTLNSPELRAKAAPLLENYFEDDASGMEECDRTKPTQLSPFSFASFRATLP